MCFTPALQHDRPQTRQWQGAGARLWAPKHENFDQVEALPLLGSGKLDMRKAKEMAKSLAAS